MCVCGIHAGDIRGIFYCFRCSITFFKVYRMPTLCRHKGEINVAHGGTIEAGILSQGHGNLTAMKEHSRCDKIFLLCFHNISITTVKLLLTVFVFSVKDCVEYSLWKLLLHLSAVAFVLNTSKTLTRRDMVLFICCWVRYSFKGHPRWLECPAPWAWLLVWTDVIKYRQIVFSVIVSVPLAWINILNPFVNNPVALEQKLLKWKAPRCSTL